MPMDEDEEVELDYSVGSGSGSRIDKKYDSSAPMEHDGRAPTETTFWPHEAPSTKKDHYQDLRDKNDEKGELPQRTRRMANRRRDAAVFSNQLGLTSYQRNRVLYTIDQLHGDEDDDEEGELNQLGPYSVEAAILSVITLVVNVDGRAIRREDEFEQLRDNLNIEKDAIKHIRQELRAEV